MDDISVFCYLFREAVVYKNGFFMCTSGEQRSASIIVGIIVNALARGFGKKTSHPEIKILRTVSVGDTHSSRIRAIIERIEKDTIHPRKDIVVYFVAKCDVSEYSISELHSGLKVFETCLSGYG